MQDEAAAALSLTIDSGASYTISSGDLDVGGTIANDGTLTGTNASIYLEGDWDNNDGVFTSGTSTVVFDGTVVQTIYSGGYGDDNDFYSLQVSNTTEAVNTTTDNLKLSGNLTLDNGSSLTLATDSQIWVVGTVAFISDPVYAAASALINNNASAYHYYGGTTGIAKASLIHDFVSGDNVRIRQGAFIQDEAAVCETLKVDVGTTYTITSGDLDVGANIDIDGTLTASSTTIYLGGNWDNDGSFISGMSTVDFDGAAAQDIYSGGTGATQDFYNL